MSLWNIRVSVILELSLRPVWKPSILSELCNECVKVFDFFIISEERMLRAVRDFDPRRMQDSQATELEHILKVRGSDSNENYSSEDKLDLYAEAIPFEREDKMITVRPTNIGYCILQHKSLFRIIIIIISGCTYVIKIFPLFAETLLGLIEKHSPCFNVCLQ